MRQLCLLGAEANGMRVLWTQSLWLTVHLQPQQETAVAFKAFLANGNLNTDLSLG